MRAGRYVLNKLFITKTYIFGAAVLFLRPFDHIRSPKQALALATLKKSSFFNISIYKLMQNTNIKQIF